MAQPRISRSAAAFFGSLIDYAGLFPPAALPLEESIINYQSYLGHPIRWALSRFILTQAHLEKLSPALIASFSVKEPLNLSLVSKSPRTDLPVAAERLRSFEGKVLLGSVEIPLAVANDYRAQIAGCEEALRAVAPSGSTISTFFELPFFSGWDEALPALGEGLSKAREQTDRLIGFKLRCGSTEPHLVPSPQRVAQALKMCAAHRLPIKFTAGLHHPFQHAMQKGSANGASDSMHGYFNVFFAAFAAYLRALSVQDIEEILLCSDSANVHFDDAAIRWGNMTIPLDEVSRLRSSMVISFGSCSFTEPLEDAEKLDWI